jgi:hypothetical protein
MKQASLLLSAAIFAAILTLLSPDRASADDTAGTSLDSNHVNVGAYYFGGWSPLLPHVTDRMRKEFADREPVWGWYGDDQATVEKEIDFAANAHLSFWAFCWYWPDTADKKTPLNDPLAFYLKAKNRDRLKFCLLVANHHGFHIGPKDWPALTEKWIALFKQPTYLTANGKPLFIIFSPSDLVQSFGGVEAAHAALDSLRAEAVKAGLPGVTIATCSKPAPADSSNGLDVVKACGFDATTGYNNHDAVTQRPGKEQLFSQLVTGQTKVWDFFAQKSSLPYIPAATVGWDRRPWETPSHPATIPTVYYSGRTPEGVEQIVRSAVTWVQKNPEHTVSDRLVILYAWNEIGEGGFLTPSKSQGTAYLDAVARGMKPAN